MTVKTSPSDRKASRHDISELIHFLRVLLPDQSDYRAIGEIIEAVHWHFHSDPSTLGYDLAGIFLRSSKRCHWEQDEIV
jgi:hypothetical protein